MFLEQPVETIFCMGTLSVYIGKFIIFTNIINSTWIIHDIISKLF